MKQIFLVAIFGFSIIICHAQQSKAMKDQQKAYDILHKKANDGRINTAPGSWNMTAVIDGKPWKANYMYSPEQTSRIIGHHDDEFISFPYRSNMSTGYKKAFSSSWAVDINLNDGVGIYGATEGEMIITKADANWIEGTFHFIAEAASGNKKLNVTNGYFKIQVK